MTESLVFDVVVDAALGLSALDVQNPVTDVFTLEGGGPPGLSAYELAVRSGFVGTQAEWIASLKGSLPSQSGQAGNFLTTDGSEPSWTVLGLATVATSGSYEDLGDKPVIPPPLPSQSGNAGKVLSTDGSAPEWIPAPSGGGGGDTSGVIVVSGGPDIAADTWGPGNPPELIPGDDDPDIGGQAYAAAVGRSAVATADNATATGSGAQATGAMPPRRVRARKPPANSPSR